MALAKLQMKNAKIPGELGHLKFEEDLNNADSCPVIFKIELTQEIYNFEMNAEKYSSFFETEKEVLLQDGLCLNVLHIENERFEADYIN